MSESPDATEVAEQIVGQCFAMRARLIERAVTQLYAEACNAQNVSVAQVTLLAAITRYPGARATDLSHRLRMDASTLSRNLNRLHKHALIEMRPGDGRSRHLFVTTEGRDILEAVHPGWQSAQQSAQQLLGLDATAVYRLAQRLSSAAPDPHRPERLGAH